MGARALSTPVQPPEPEGRDPDEGAGDGATRAERVRERAEEVRGRTRERADEVRERTRERADEVRERTRERAEQVKDRAGEVKERTKERAEQVRDRTREQTERARMTVSRLFGLDRSGPPPPETLPGQPLRVWTIPNAVGLVRLACIPVFLVVALRTDTGVAAVPAIVFATIAGTDYLDGFLARATGQYSRFGAYLDPVTDRSLVLAGGVVCWKFELVPRWALAVLVGREVFMLFAGRAAVSLGIALKINWWGRLAVWPLMGGLFAALVGVGWPAEAAVVAGVGMALVATGIYTLEAYRELRRRAVARRAATH